MLNHYNFSIVGHSITSIINIYKNVKCPASNIIIIIKRDRRLCKESSIQPTKYPVVIDWEILVNITIYICHLSLAKTLTKFILRNEFLIPNSDLFIMSTKSAPASSYYLSFPAQCPANSSPLVAPVKANTPQINRGTWYRRLGGTLPIAPAGRPAGRTCAPRAPRRRAR